MLLFRWCQHCWCRWEIDHLAQDFGNCSVLALMLSHQYNMLKMLTLFYVYIIVIIEYFDGKLVVNVKDTPVV